MKKLSSDQVKKVAALANIPLTPDEETTYTDQLSKILDYIETLNSVDTSQIEPTYNVTGLANIQAEDQVEESLSQDQALQNAPQKENGLPDGSQGYFVTKGVFEE